MQNSKPFQSIHNQFIYLNIGWTLLLPWNSSTELYFFPEKNPILFFFTKRVSSIPFTLYSIPERGLGPLMCSWLIQRCFEATRCLGEAYGLCDLTSPRLFAWLYKTTSTEVLELTSFTVSAKRVWSARPPPPPPSSAKSESNSSPRLSGHNNYWWFAMKFSPRFCRNNFGNSYFSSSIICPIFWFMTKMLHNQLNSHQPQQCCCLFPSSKC